MFKTTQVNVKSSLCRPWRYLGGSAIQLRSFLTSASDGAELLKKNTQKTLYFEEKGSRNRCRDGGPIRLLDEARRFSLLQSVNTVPGAHNPVFNGYRGLYNRKQGDQSVKLTTHVRLMLRILMSLAVWLQPHTHKHSTCSQLMNSARYIMISEDA
jgi:hypothetical protein